MGNALVVGIIEQLGKELFSRTKIYDKNLNNQQNSLFFKYI